MSIKSVIIDAVRSPIGLKNGQLIGIRPCMIWRHK